MSMKYEIKYIIFHRSKCLMDVIILLVSTPSLN